MYIAYKKKAKALLDAQSIAIHPDFELKIARFRDMIADWNDFASLMAADELKSRFDVHIADALSLLPYVSADRDSRTRVLDVGTGAGFPGLVLSIADQELEMFLVERSTKKCAFLDAVIANLELENVHVIHQEFGPSFTGSACQVYLSRAVDKPRKIFQAVLNNLPIGALYLCQLNVDNPPIEARFHVEHIQDEWKKTGLRRGNLIKIIRND